MIDIDEFETKYTSSNWYLTNKLEILVGVPLHMGFLV